MNIYVVIEGEKAVKKLYASWIPFVNKSLRQVDYLTEFKDGNFFILAGQGQPGYWQKVENAVRDVNNIKSIDRLVVSVDSENNTYTEKLDEAKECVERIGCRVKVKYVIQHFCLETWLLGNIHMFRKNAQDPDLVKYLEFFNVRNRNPDDLPPYEELNRSQFAFRYLKAGIRDTFQFHKKYNKQDPGIACEEGYFSQIKKRCVDNHHIQSFNGFLEAFI